MYLYCSIAPHTPLTTIDNNQDTAQEILTTCFRSGVEHRMQQKDLVSKNEILLASQLLKNPIPFDVNDLNKLTIEKKPGNSISFPYHKYLSLAYLYHKIGESIATRMYYDKFCKGCTYHTFQLVNILDYLEISEPNKPGAPLNQEQAMLKLEKNLKRFVKLELGLKKFGTDTW